jgi:hypothetical protein
MTTNENELKILREQLKQTEQIFKQYGSYMFGSGMAAGKAEIANGRPFTEDELKARLVNAGEQWKRYNNLD